jgi:glycosyltransferase involved in cell wall biosynthesis
MHSISVVCTVYNAEQIVDELVKRIIENVSEVTNNFELILVDDCSRDNSWGKVRVNCEKDHRIKGIRLSRNFGQQIAMSAGLRYAKGEYILIMDGDLQNPPSEIPRLYQKIQEGYDIVYTVSKVRNDFFDELTSKLFWFVLVKLFKVNIVKDQLMMKIMTKHFVDKYNAYGEINRTVMGITKDIGLNYTVIEVQNTKRITGKSNYTFFKRLNLMIDIIISITTAPLNIMIHIGWIVFVITIIALLVKLYDYLFNNILPGYTSLILSISFFGSLTIFLLGFIGRYLANIYIEVRNRPLFVTRELINTEESQ